VLVEQDNHDQVELETHGRLKLLGVHHETAITGYGYHRAAGKHEFRGNGRRQAGPHGLTLDTVGREWGLMAVN
jgi:hypothetical protein